MEFIYFIADLTHFQQIPCYVCFAKKNEENLVDILRGNDVDIKSRTQTPQNESETELLLESMTHGHFSYKLKVKWEEK